MKLDKADKLVSKLAREKTPYCQNCGKKNCVLNAHHIFPRGRSSTRYDLKNILVLCVQCHTFSDNSVHKSPEGSKKFCIRIIGAKEYRRLELLSLQYKSRSKAKSEFLEKYGK